MPFEHVIDAKKRLLTIHGYGTCSAQTACDALRQAFCSVAHGMIPADYGVIINMDDFVRADTLAGETRLEQFVTLLQGHLRGPIALVAAAVGNVMPAHLMATQLDGPHGAVQAFMDEALARNWILRRLAEADGCSAEEPLESSGPALCAAPLSHAVALL